jgi:modulator of FtsH protease
VGYTTAGWAGFATAAATAAAALAGFLFIAVSINLARILDSPNLPGRAGLTLMLLATPLVTMLVVLIPGQGRVALGAELLVTGLVVAALQLGIDLRTPRSEHERPATWVISRVTPAVVCCGCIVIAGITLLGGAGGGLYWLVPSVIGAFAFGLMNVWVLLVEILR